MGNRFVKAAVFELHSAKYARPFMLKLLRRRVRLAAVSQKAFAGRTLKKWGIDYFFDTIVDKNSISHLVERDVKGNIISYPYAKYASGCAEQILLWDAAVKNLGCLPGETIAAARCMKWAESAKACGAGLVILYGKPALKQDIPSCVHLVTPCFSRLRMGEIDAVFRKKSSS